MGDDNGGADGGGDVAPDSGGGEIESHGFDALSAGTDASMTSRLDTIHGTLSTLGMRIDALVTSTTSYRSALTDRLTEYADLVSKLTRTQASDLDEYRRSNERAIADLRRSLSGTDEVMERVGARIDSLLTDSESADDQSRRMLTEVRSIVEAQESLSRFLTESLDQFGERVLSQLSTSQAATLEQLETVRMSLEPDQGAQDAVLASLAPFREGLERVEVQLADTSRDERTADRLARISQRLDSLAEIDPAAALAGRFDGLHAVVDPLAGRFDGVHAAIDMLSTADQVSNLSADIRAQLSGLASAIDGGPLTGQISQIAAALDERGQGTDDARSEIAGLRAKLDDVIALAGADRNAAATKLDEISETLVDVASGEVVGALWDEVHGLRGTIDSLAATANRSVSADAVAALRAEISGIGVALDSLVTASQVDRTDDGVAALRTEVTGLTAAVQDLLEQAEIADDFTEPPAPDPVLVGLANDVGALRDELSRGLVVEPSDALAGTVDELRSDLAALDGRMAALTELQRSVTELSEDGTLTAVAADIAALRSRVEAGSAEQNGQGDQIRAELQSEFESLQTKLVSLLEGMRPVAPDVDDADVEGELQVLRSGVENLDAGMRSMRSGVEDIIARLDEGLVIDADSATPASAASAVPELADQLATMRDLVSTEFDDLRRMVGAIEIGEAPAPAPSSAAHASIDPDTLDLLRDEIRTGGAVSEDLVEALRKELIALRRRIKLRAEGEILTTAQLELIADSVARRLAE